MKSKARNASLLAPLLALSTAVGAHIPAAHADDPSQQIEAGASQAVAVVEQFSAALKAGDLERAGALLADDVVILESGGAERSRQEYLGGHAMHDAAFLKDATSELKHRIARIDGSLAWVASESELHASEDGNSMTLLSTETMVLDQMPSGWKIVHIHWSSRPK